MTLELVEHHLRRAWQYSLVSALMAAAVLVLSYLASGFSWSTRFIAACALVAWANVIVLSLHSRVADGAVSTEPYNEGGA